MGTVVEITVSSTSEHGAREAIKAAFGEMEGIERVLSSHRNDSPVSRLNANGNQEAVFFDHEIIGLFDLALEVGKASSGAFDITIGRVVDLWRFDQGGVVPDQLELSANVSRVGLESVVLDKNKGSVGFSGQGFSIDLGGVAKGWAVDRAVQRLRSLGIRNAIVDAGGDLRLLGARPGKNRWRIGIQHPRQPGRLLLTLDLTDTAIVTSGDYERFFLQGGTRYHHILDPRTGMPARGCQSVTVIGPTAAEADACATAAFVMGPEKGIAFLRSRKGLRGVIVDASGGLHWTDEALAAGAHL